MGVDQFHNRMGSVGQSSLAWRMKHLVRHSLSHHYFGLYARVDVCGFMRKQNHFAG